jgi:hypothetical protein
MSQKNPKHHELYRPTSHASKTQTPKRVSHQVGVPLAHHRLIETAQFFCVSSRRIAFHLPKVALSFASLTSFPRAIHCRPSPKLSRRRLCITAQVAPHWHLAPPTHATLVSHNRQSDAVTSPFVSSNRTINMLAAPSRVVIFVLTRRVFVHASYR